jgi:hypothetical protein
VIAAKEEGLSVALGVDGGGFVYGHATNRIFGHIHLRFM